MENPMRRSCTPVLLALPIAFLIATGCAQAAEKRNLLEDGASFEVGVDGFSLNSFYLLSHHGHEIAPVFDSTTAVDGQYSLRLDNPLGDKIVLTFRPIRLPKTTRVTVSGYLKGEGRVRVQLMRWPFETVARAEVDLTPEWRRFSFPGTIKNDQSYFLWILPAVSTRRVWLDALQIEEGELSEFHPRALELSAAVTAPYNTYWVGQRCVLTVRLYAPRPPASIPLSVRVLDIFRREVFNTRLVVDTQGRQHVDVTVPLFAGDRRGSYKVIVEAGEAGAVEREVFTFGVLRAVTWADLFFAFNLKQLFNEDDERRYSDNNAEMELVYANAPLEYTLGLLRRVGAASLRCFRIAEHARIERRSGEFVWRDGYLDLQKQAGLEPPLVVLNAFGPLWEADPAFPAGGRRWAISTRDAWRNYVRAMVRHYKGQVRYYEVVNEPETVFRDVKAYVERLKAAHDVIREEDPAAKIVAPSYSGGNPYPWLEAFCKAGGHRWTDIWAIHYAGRTLPERGMDRTTPTWEQIRKYREILVKANGGVDKPFWNTEGGSFYWSPEYDHWPRAEDQGYEDIADEHYRIPSETLAAAYTPRLQLIEKACGIERLYSFEFGFYYSQNASKATDIWSMYVNYDGSPSPALVTYNAVADLFAGTKPVELLALDHHVVATVFERGGKSVVAVWKGAPVTEYPGFEPYDRPVWVDLRLKPETLSLTDMLGNPLQPEARDGGVRLTATAYPLYFTSAVAPAEVVQALRSARLAEGPRPKIDAAPEALIEAHQFSAAIAALQERLAAEPGSAQYLAKMGTCCSALKRYGEAMQWFTKALAADPEIEEANRGMARCQERYDRPGVSWAQRMAGAAECMGRAAKPVLARVQAEGKGSYSDLVDIVSYEYYLSGATHVPGNAAKALAMIALAQKIAPPSNWRVQAMLKHQAGLERAAARDAAREGKP